MEKMYFVRVNVKGESDNTFVVSGRSISDSGIYHRIETDRYYGIKFNEENIIQAIALAKADFGTNYTVKKEYAGMENKR